MTTRMPTTEPAGAFAVTEPAQAALVRRLAWAAAALRRCDARAAARAAPRPPLTRATLEELCRALAADLARLEAMRREVAPGAAAARRPALSPRERAVAALVAAGLRDREVAAALGIAVRTAEKHAEHVWAKLGLRSRYHLAAPARSGAAAAA